MKPAQFNYHAPATVEEAVALLAKFASEDGRVLAGGQSLVPTMAFRLARPRHLIDINGIATLGSLAVRDGDLCIGAGVRHAAFHDACVEGALGTLMAEIVQYIAHRPIRARGTFCGSIAHADPASEWCALATALDAQMVAHSARGARIIDASVFFRGIMTTALADDELLTEVRLPLPPADMRFGFAEYNRRSGDFAVAMAIAGVRMVDGKLAGVRIGIGGAESSPRRIATAEVALNGRSPEAASLDHAADVAAAALEPIDDHQNSADYRRAVARAMVRRALQAAVVA